LSQHQNGPCAPFDSACAATPCNVLPPQVCSRMGSATQRKVMISCAVTGSADTPGRNPAVPVTPTQIAQSALDAAKAGAAIVHVHVRDPKTTRPSMVTSLFKEVVERIRESVSDVVITLT